eukprot:TRINITY_DN19109_c0_g1_i1.p1 TRINITY_DN19109_c0_g1~~TRINITY_DN19109_c0_g1_i1.p1  ORF type:complete len:449 (-),score=89.62 TRINITY_DN19109_c0_g1_i1:490-1836(-)
MATATRTCLTLGNLHVVTAKDDLHQISGRTLVPNFQGLRTQISQRTELQTVNSRKLRGSRLVTLASTGDVDSSPSTTDGTAQNTQVLVASISSEPPPPPPSSNVLGYTAAAVGIGLAGAAVWNVISSPKEAEQAPASEPAPPKNGAAAVVEEAAPPPPPVPEVPVYNTPAFPLGVKQAHPKAVETINKHYSAAQEMGAFLHAVQEELFDQGFNRDNCIALVNTCRDEVCRPIVNYIDEEFGHSFNTAGLGGLVNCGVTGFKAGMSHSPEHPCETDGSLRERYIFFAFPHISIGETGETGSLLRRGRGKPSSACGALIAIKGEASQARDETKEPYPSDDFEYVSLRRKVLSKKQCQCTDEGGPSLVDVTNAALEVITEDLEDLISKTVDPKVADYAVVTGVQIHSGWQLEGEPFRLDRTVDYIAPHKMYAVIRGERREMECAPRSKLYA